MSRIRIFVLFAALAALATTFAACGGGSDDETSSGDPQQILDNATLEGVESGSLDISIGIKATGDEPGEIDVSLSGPFQSKGAGDLPELALEASADGKIDGESIDFEGGLTLLADRAFVNFEGDEYEVDPTTFGFVKSGFEQAQSEGKEESDLAACQKAAEGIAVGDFANELTEEGSVDVDGTSTTKVSGELEIGGAIDAIIKLTEDPACASQLEAAGPLPVGELEEAKGELEKTVKDAHVDVYVGDDDIIRRIDAKATIKPEGSNETVDLEIDVTLSGVNEDQSISAPSGAKPLEDLFQKIGVNPLELLEAGNSGDIGGLLEEITGESAGGGNSGGGGGGGGGSSGGNSSPEDPQAYLECLEGAQTPADLQKCASKLR